MTDPERLSNLIERVLLREADDAEFEELVSWLKADESHREQFLAEVDFYRTVRGALLDEQHARAAGDFADNTGSFVAILHDLEPHGPVPSVVMQDPLSYDAYAPQGRGIKALRAFAQPWFWIGAGVAAVFAVAVTLAVVFSGNSTPTGLTVTTPRYAPQSTPEQRDSPAANAPAIVATLTATRNAQWAEHPAEGASAPGGPASIAPVPGDTLRAGTRLTLTAGFAEITTARGAIAILEAPATIELTDSDNAIRLHTGRLVGICETPMSQGFVVRTPHMVVTDIGTRFGVDARQGVSTSVHVLAGRVEARPAVATDRDDNGETIVAGQSAQVRSGTEQLIRGVADRAAFAFAAELDERALEPVVEHFDAEEDGQFAPDGGRGWSGPWEALTHRGVQVNLSSPATNPLTPGSGPYLQAAFRTSDDAGMGTIARPFGRPGHVDRARPHRVRFLFRVDEKIEAAPEFAYRVSIYDSPQARSGTSMQDTWMLVAFSNPSAAEDHEDAIGKNGVAAWSWSFYDPQAGNSVEQFDLSRMQDTGVPLVPGQTYEVEIHVNPRASEWDFVIASGSHRYDSRAALGRSIRFRSGASEAGGVLHFNLRHTQPDAENRIHIDEIEIDALPDSRSTQSLSDRDHQAGVFPA